MRSRHPPSEKPSRTSERVQLAKAVEASKQSATPQGVSKRKRFRRPRQRKSCYLFKLPAELRNAIYRNVLVNPGHIRINPKGPRKPPLLYVCRGIRKEARTIYYAENIFQLKITAFNGAEFTRFGLQYNEHQHLVPKDKSGIIFMLDNEANWKNLMAWVKADFFGQDLRPCLKDPVGPCDYVVGAAFRISDAVPFKYCQHGWNLAEKALEAFRHGLRGTCSRWAHGEDEDDDGVH